MSRSKWAILIIVAILLIIFLVWLLIIRLGPAAETSPYVESFDEPGEWIVGEGAYSMGEITNGVYDMYVEQTGDFFWTTAGRVFADGAFSVEATPVEGTMDNGYGLLFRVDKNEESFYLFKISSDGFVFVGRCLESCLEQNALVDRDWFSSPAVLQGLGVTNQLRVIADGPQMTFFVNDTEVGQVTNDELTKGDIGLMAETFTPGGFRVTFDNFTVTPLSNE